MRDLIESLVGYTKRYSLGFELRDLVRCATYCSCEFAVRGRVDWYVDVLVLMLGRRRTRFDMPRMVVMCEVNF